MASHQPDRLGVIGTLRFYRQRLHIMLLTMGMAFKKRMKGTAKGEPLIKTIAISLLTCSRFVFTDELYRRQTRPSTGDTIRAFCKSAKLKHRSVNLDDEPAAILHFIGDEKKKILYYLHGGGYLQPMTGPGHTSFAIECATAADAQLVVLEYTLAPDLQYPGQLTQAVHGLNYLLKSHPPSDLIMGGDSAGGNLVLAVLAHIKQKSNYAPTVDLQGQYFKGIYLICPWVGLDYATDSYVRNDQHDFITKDPQMLAVTNYWNPKREDVYCNQLSGSKEFWSGTIESTVSNTLIVTGTREIFFDDIMEFSKKVGASEEKFGKIRVVPCEGEVHTSCLLDSAVKLKPMGMRKVIVDWLRTLV